MVIYYINQYFGFSEIFKFCLDSKFIDALKANLIEYEERYEMCKNENAETVQQLEKLSNDFERLRLSFENSKTKSASDAVVR